MKKKLRTVNSRFVGGHRLDTPGIVAHITRRSLEVVTSVSTKSSISGDAQSTQENGLCLCPWTKTQKQKKYNSTLVVSATRQLMQTLLFLMW